MRNLRIISVALAAITALIVILGVVLLSAAGSLNFVTTGGAVTAEINKITPEEAAEILINGGFTITDDMLGPPEGYDPGSGFIGMWNKVKDYHNALMGRDENNVIDEKKQLLRYFRYTKPLCPSSEGAEIIIELDLSSTNVTEFDEYCFDAFLQVAIGYNLLGSGAHFAEKVTEIDVATGDPTKTEEEEEEVNITESIVTDIFGRNSFSMRVILPEPAEGEELIFHDRSLSARYYTPNAIELDISGIELKKNADGSVSGINMSANATSGSGTWGNRSQMHLHWITAEITAEDDLTQQEYAFKNGVDFILAGGAGSTVDFNIYSELCVKLGKKGLAVPVSEIGRITGSNAENRITVYAAENPKTGYADHTDVVNMLKYLYANYVTKGFPNMFEETNFYHVLLNEDNTPESTTGTVTVDETLDIYCSHRPGEAIGIIGGMTEA